MNGGYRLVPFYGGMEVFYFVCISLLFMISFRVLSSFELFVLLLNYCDYAICFSSNIIFVVHKVFGTRRIVYVDFGL